MTTGARVLAAIDDALVIRQRHPALFARMARAGMSCLALSHAFDAYLADRSTAWWFTGDSLDPRVRAKRRAVAKRQRQARKVQQAKTRRRK